MEPTRPTRHAAKAAAIVLAAVLGGLGCNSLTGANGLEVDDNYGVGSGKKKKKPIAPDAADPGAGATSGGDTAGGGEELPPAASLVGAPGVTIDSIAIYQGVKRGLMEGGAAVTSGAPVVAGRDALVRVFASTNGDYDGGPVTARLSFDTEGAPFEQSITVPGNPGESSLGSTVNFHVPGAALTTATSYRVELLQEATEKGANPSATFPVEGFQGAQAQSSGSSLKVVLIPIAYGADGSSRLPDTSGAQVQRYADAIYAMYPVPSVEVTVHAAVQWDSAVSASGSGWDTLLNAMADFRESESAAKDTYYYGIFSPGSSMNSYCSGGCVAGLGFIAGAFDANVRVAIGLGFTGESAAETAAHELGHNHGREHAPCGGAAGTDPSFPYSNGSIGTWGHDLVTDKLFNPNSTSDVMSYCSPIWVSDYTFDALFDRVQTVNGASVSYPADTLNRTYDRAAVGPDGALSWMAPVKLRTPPMGEPTDVIVNRKDGVESLTGALHRYDHLPGGVLLWPRVDAPSITVNATIGGVSRQLQR